MKRCLLLLVIVGSLAQLSHAQSTITLEELDLGPTSETSAGPLETTDSSQSGAFNVEQLQMKSCLESAASCNSSEFGNTASFSIDDVVNLGVVDRQSVLPQKINSGENQQQAAAPLPTIDIEIQFDYQSSDVRPDQIGKLMNLAELLKNSEFKNFRYAFFGHTDRKGSYAYNQDLSQNRADSVMEVVASLSKLPENRFVARGLSYTRLKPNSDPFGAENRRVQLVLVPLK